MSLRSGLAAQLGYVSESAWSTRTAPDHWVEFTSENIKLKLDYIRSKGLRANNRMLRSDRILLNKKGAAGDINMEVGSNGFALFLKHMLGAIATTTPMGGTTSKTHTATIGDQYGLGLGVQIGRPDVGGVVRPFDYVGGKVLNWELSNAVDGLLLCKLGCDFQDEKTNQTLATASYPAGNQLLSYSSGIINVASVAAAVKDIKITGVTGQKADRYFIQNSTLKKEPIPGEWMMVTGEVTAEFEDLTAYTRFTAGTLAQIDATWTAATVIEGSIYPSLKATLNNVLFTGDTPEVKDASQLELKLPFECLYDGSTGPISLALTTSDATP